MPLFIPTADMWEAWFSARPRQQLNTPFDAVVDGQELWHARFAHANLAITVDSTWPGLGALDDQRRIGSVQFSLGRWYIDDTAISCISDHGEGDFDITLDRVLDTDWVAHMFGKRWFYDPTDFFDTLEEARRRQQPKDAAEDEEWLDALMLDEVQSVLQLGEQFVLPSRKTDGHRTYLVDRMSAKERRAFAEFMERQKYALS